MVWIVQLCEGACWEDMGKFSTRALALRFALDLRNEYEDAATCPIRILKLSAEIF